MNLDAQPDITQLRGPVPLSHLLIRQFVRSGDRVIDATCGNGHDTLMLAELVGPNGLVWAFDIQQKAIDQTSDRLVRAGCNASSTLVLANHAYIAAHCVEPINAAIFNLGYLPGGDRSLVTRPETTWAGIEQSLEILVRGGIVAISIYPGHEGGGQERAELEQRLARLAPRNFHVWRMAQMNVPVEAPYLLLIQKAFP